MERRDNRKNVKIFFFSLLTCCDLDKSALLGYIKHNDSKNVSISFRVNYKIVLKRKTCPCDRVARYIFVPRVILYNCFLFWLIYGGLGFGVLGLESYMGFLGLGFSVDGVWGLWCGAFWVFGVGALYINMKE